MTAKPRWWRRVQRPWVTAALLSLLAADAWWVLHAPTHERESAAAVRVMELQERLTGRAPARAAGYEWSRAAALGAAGGGVGGGVGGQSLFVIRGDDGVPLRLVHQDSASWDELSGLLASEPERVASVVALWGSRETGVWGMTRRHDRDVVGLEPWEPGSFAGVAPEAVRPLLAAGLPGWGGAAEGAADQSRTCLLPLGYLHNAAALVTLAALLVSLGWVPRVPAACRARRGRRRLARGVCPRCRYSHSGLEEARCPECGEVW